MNFSVAKFKTKRASKFVAGTALAVLGGAALGVAGAPWAAFADEAERPALTPLDLSPPSTAATVDFTPTAALARPAPPPARLDLSPPPGMAIQLPPEAAATPSFIDATASPRSPFDVDGAGDKPNPPPPATKGAVEATAPPSAAPEGAEVMPTLPAAAATPAAAAPPNPRGDTPDVAVARPDLPAPAAAEPVAAPETPSVDAVRAALDAWLAVKPVGRPLGAGDWEAARRAIASVYAEGGYAPLWIEGGDFSARAKAALARLARADEDGLTLPPLPAQARRAEADVALSAAVVAYALQASGARIVPRYLSKDVSAKPEVADPAAALKAVSSAPDADAALEAFNPPHAGYRALRAALAALRGAERSPVARLFGGPALKLGMSDPRVPLIRARFGLGAAPATAQVYDVRVVSAVAAFQRVHGLSPNGTLTEATADALAGGGEVIKARRLIANMEMWRWLPRDLGETRVEVNLPDFSLKVTSGGQVVRRARVIVGKPDTPTPVFSDTIRYLLLNPAWHVPDSIVKKEMAPRLASDPNYLARRGFKVTYVGDKLTVEQPPGEANALGRMLFLFPNEHAVYLHDTPQRQLFGQNFRALSHGCVRVEDPAALAELLMGGPRRGWSQDRIRSLLGDKERTYTLAAPVPVHLEYFTEFVDERGAVESRDDLYGLTDKVISALSGLRRD
jgi:murein L,D-transpeptidase YcbB/YkuD